MPRSGLHAERDQPGRCGYEQEGRYQGLRPVGLTPDDTDMIELHDHVELVGEPQTLYTDRARGQGMAMIIERLS